MFKKILILISILTLVALFIATVIPKLSEVKIEPKKSEPVVMPERVLDMDISIESICQNLLTGEQNTQCSRDNCDRTCRTEGCKFFGLEYMASNYTDRCICNCFEENKIKKALTPVTSQ